MSRTRPSQLLLAAIICFTLAVAVILFLAANHAGAASPVQDGQRVTEWGRITSVTYVSGLTRYVSGTTRSGRYFGAYTVRFYRAGQRVRISGTTHGNFLENVRIL